MKDATDYQPAQQFGLLLIGESGAGKSSLLMEWPGVYILDGDRNLRSALDLYQRRHGTPKTDFWFDAPELDENGKRLPDHEVWPNVWRLAEKNAKDPRVLTIGLDGLTRANDWLMAYIIKQGGDMERPLKVGGLTMMTKSLYQPFAMEMTKLLLNLRRLEKPLIVTAHIRSGESDLTETTVWQPNMVGSMRGTIPGSFTDYWLCDTEQVTPGTPEAPKYPTGVKYFVRTAPRPQVKLKNSLGLPPVFEFTWAAFEPYLQRTTTATKGTP